MLLIYLPSRLKFSHLLVMQVPRQINRINKTGRPARYHTEVMQVPILGAHRIYTIGFKTLTTAERC